MAEGNYNPDLITKTITETTDNTGNILLTDISPANAILISAVQLRNAGKEGALCFCFPCQNYSDSTYLIHVVGSDLTTQANKTFAIRYTYRPK